jgi:hypothetical protein
MAWPPNVSDQLDKVCTIVHRCGPHTQKTGQICLYLQIVNAKLYKAIIHIRKCTFLYKLVSICKLIYSSGGHMKAWRVNENVHCKKCRRTFFRIPS